MSDMPMRSEMPAVVIPWFDSGDPQRRQNYDHVRRVYAHYRIYVGTGHNRGSARNDGAVKAMRAGERVLFFVDADMIIPRSQIEMAAQVASLTGTLVYPYTYLTRLNLSQTQRVIMGAAPDPNMGQAEAGAAVITAESFKRVNGFPNMDVLEDALFHNACLAILGPNVRLSGYAWHMWHKETNHIGDTGSRKILNLFEHAATDSARMLDLVNGSPYYEGLADRI